MAMNCVGYWLYCDCHEYFFKKYRGVILIRIVNIIRRLPWSGHGYQRNFSYFTENYPYRCSLEKDRSSSGNNTMW